MSFWETHGVWFVIAMFFFPRLTMLFGTVFGGGLLYWIGWLLVPRLTVAIIATMLYRETDLTLAVVTWAWAVVLEIAEKFDPDEAKQVGAST